MVHDVQLDLVKKLRKGEKMVLKKKEFEKINSVEEERV